MLGVAPNWTIQIRRSGPKRVRKPKSNTEVQVSCHEYFEIVFYDVHKFAAQYNL
jgi:hypothetical protein